MEWFSYLLKVSICMTLFYTFYHLFLQKLTFFRINRYYLLSTLLISLVIPFTTLTIERIEATSPEISSSIIDQRLFQVNPVQEVFPVVGGVNDPSRTTKSTAVGDKIELVMSYVYWGTSVVLLLLFLIQMIDLLKPALKGVRKVGRLKVIYKPEGFTNCSFFNYVFVDDAHLSEAEIEILLYHEAVHASKYHSLDKLLITMCKIVLWFNPVVYLYSNALELIHEYEADEEASLSFGDTVYASLLLRMAVQKKASPLTHHFALIPVKERIKMLFIQPSTKMKKTTYLAVLPVLAVLLLSFSVKTVYKGSEGLLSYMSVPDDVHATPSDSISPYRQKTKIRLTAAQLEEKKKFDLWHTSEDYKKKTALASNVINKKFSVTVKGKYFPKTNISEEGYLISVGNETYLLAFGNNKSKAVLKSGEVLDIEVNGAGIVQDVPYITLITSNVIRNGENIYKAMPVPVNAFLYEVNKVRFTDGFITKMVDAGNQAKDLYVSANGYTFLVKINAKQTKMNMFSDFTKGDNVRLRFINEQKTGAKSYLIKDWIAISKDIKSYGLHNDQLFNRFYERSGEERKAIVVQERKSDDKIEYSAQDSTKMTKSMVYLYGQAKISWNGLNVAADEIRYDLKGQTAIAKNVVLQQSGSNMSVKGAYVRINMKDGLYTLSKTMDEF